MTVPLAAFELNDWLANQAPALILALLWAWAGARGLWVWGGSHKEAMEQAMAATAREKVRGDEWKAEAQKSGPLAAKATDVAEVLAARAKILAEEAEVVRRGRGDAT